MQNLLPVISALLLQHVSANASADLPIKERQTSVDGPGNGFAGREDQFAHIRKQRGGNGDGLGDERAGLGLGGHGEGKVARPGGFGKGELSPQCGEIPHAI